MFRRRSGGDEREFSVNGVSGRTVVQGVVNTVVKNPWFCPSLDAPNDPVSTSIGCRRGK